MQTLLLKMRFINMCMCPGSVYIDCNTANVIYLLTCTNWGLQYVGDTVKKLNERFNNHRSGIKSPVKNGTCRRLSDDFHKTVSVQYKHWKKI